MATPEALEEQALVEAAQAIIIDANKEKVELLLITCALKSSVWN